MLSPSRTVTTPGTATRHSPTARPAIGGEGQHGRARCAAPRRRPLRRIPRFARTLLPGRQDAACDRSARSRRRQSLRGHRRGPRPRQNTSRSDRCDRGAVIDARDHDELRAHVSELLAHWQSSVADVYVKFGAPQSTAGDQATVLGAAIGGALVLARARRSTQPLDAVEQHFKAAASGSRRRG